MPLHLAQFSSLLETGCFSLNLQFCRFILFRSWYLGYTLVDAMRACRAARTWVASNRAATGSNAQLGSNAQWVTVEMPYLALRKSDKMTEP